MKTQIDLRGASGAAYRFRLVEEPMQLPTASGNFVFVKSEIAGASVIYAGEAAILSEATARWADARGAYGADAIYVRLNISESVRLAEQADLVEQYNPPMNAAA
ncbi:MAG TPA: hypothetical protein VFW47_15190 [Phenylobacterium sp.]|nr:hypothetical protein [Phenylobacterium sp.]